MSREGIKRFWGPNSLSPIEFLSILKIIKNRPHSIDVVEKMDGFFIHFGINERREFFIETSNSGQITKNNYEKKLSNIYYFSDFKYTFEYLMNDSLFQETLLSAFHKWGAVRYDAELFPVGTHFGDEKDGVVFVATRYSKPKLGTKGSFVVFKSWISDRGNWQRPLPYMNEEIVDHIQKGSTEEWKIFTNEKDAKIHSELDFSGIYLPPDLEDIDSCIQILKSRKIKEKKNIKNIIESVSKEFQYVLDECAEKSSSVFSSDGEFSPIEGIILRIKNEDGSVVEVKGTSSTFNSNKNNLWKWRILIEEKMKELYSRLALDALGLKTSHPQTLNKEIKNLSMEMEPIGDMEENELKFLDSLYDKLKDPQKEYIYDKPIEIVNRILRDINKILSDFVNEHHEMDVDSIRKTILCAQINLKEFYEKFQRVSYGKIDLLKLVLGRRLETYAARHMNREPTDFSPYYKDQTPVIVWNGRAQPWHRGHDAMIQIGKSKLKECGAEKILIMLVKGDKTSNDTIKNPLTEEEQIELIQNIYKDDPTVEVCPYTLSSSNSTSVWEKLELVNCYSVGWLAGPDRINSYKSDLSRFNAHLWMGDHSHLPLKVNDRGNSAVDFIETERVMSGTECRENVMNMDFHEWYDNTSPMRSCKNSYRKVYDILKERLKEK